ncbi:hypothetical protein ABZ401_25740, partial [Streptomyces sp. NPDC005892]|uniref:hypothetical protein n=1 Tax=Streptomyces sp. NPDC005892 TaxID=3155593 RepID=UPI0033DE7042
MAFIDQSVKRTAPNFPEQVRDQFVRSMSVFTGTGGGAQRYLVDFSGQLRQVSGGVQKTASDILETKWELIAELVRLLIELAVLAALEFFFPGTATAAKAALMAQARLRMLARLLELLHRGRALSLLMAAFHEGVDEAFQSLAVRLAMMKFAPAGLRPGSVDWKKIGESALVGGLMGGFFKPIHSVLDRGKQFLPGGAGGSSTGAIKGLDKDRSGLPGYHAPTGGTPTTSGPGGVGTPGATGTPGTSGGLSAAGGPSGSGRAARHTYDFFNDATSEGLAESFAESAAGVLMGRGFSFSVGTALGAGLSSMSEQVLFGGVAIAAGAYQKWRGAQALTSSPGGSPAPVNSLSTAADTSGTSGTTQASGSGSSTGVAGGLLGRPGSAFSTVSEAEGVGSRPVASATGTPTAVPGTGDGRNTTATDPAPYTGTGASGVGNTGGARSASDRTQTVDQPETADRTESANEPRTANPSAADQPGTVGRPEAGDQPSTVARPTTEGAASPVTGAGPGAAATSGGGAGDGRVRESGDPQPESAAEQAVVEDGTEAAPQIKGSPVPSGADVPAAAVAGPASSTATPAAARTADWVRQVLGSERAETGGGPAVPDSSQTSAVEADATEAVPGGAAPGGAVPESGTPLAPVLAVLGVQPGQVAVAGDGLLGALVGTGGGGHVTAGGAASAPVQTRVSVQAGERLADALTAELNRPATEGRPLWDALDGRAQAAWTQGLVGGGSAQAPGAWGDDQRRALVGALRDPQAAPQVAGTGTPAAEANVRQPARPVPTDAVGLATESGTSWQEGAESATDGTAASESGGTGFDDDASSVSSHVSDDLWDTGSIATETSATTAAGEPGMPGAVSFLSPAAEQTPTFWNDLKAETDSTLRDLGIDRTVDVEEVRELYTSLSADDRALARNMSDLAFRIAARIAVPGGRLGLPGGATLDEDWMRDSADVQVAAASEILRREASGKGKKRDRTREELEAALERFRETESDLAQAVTEYARWSDYAPGTGAAESRTSREQHEEATTAFYEVQRRHERADAELQTVLERAQRDAATGEQPDASALPTGSGEAASESMATTSSATPETSPVSSAPGATTAPTTPVTTTAPATETASSAADPAPGEEAESEPMPASTPTPAPASAPEPVPTAEPSETVETPGTSETVETTEAAGTTAPEWREVASAGPGGRPYRVEVPGGLIEATPDGTRLAPNGWVAYGSDLLHLESAMVMDGSDGRLVPVPPEFLEYLAEFSGAPKLTLGLDGQGLLFTGEDGGANAEKGFSPVRVAVISPPSDGPGPETVVPARDDEEGAVATGLPELRPDVTEDRISGWARSWGVPERRVHLALRHPWFQPSELDGLANTLALSTEDRARLLDLSEEIGRVPVDMPALAAQSGMRAPADFHRIALDLRIDPRHLTNLFGDRLRELGRGMAEDAGLLVASVRNDLLKTYPGATHPREHSWLLRVAAHHDIPWRAFTAGGVLGYLHDHRREVGPASVPYDSRPVADLLERARWELPPVSAESLGHTPRQLAELAPRIGTSKHKLAEAAGYWWFRPGEALGLRRSLGVSSGDRLLELVKATHRVPTDIEDLARQLEIPRPKDLYQVARDLRADPRDLVALLGDRLRGLGRPSESGPTETPARLATEIRGLLRATYPDTGKNTQATAWLLKVATHHGVSWADFAHHGVLAHLHEHREIAVAGTTPYDSEIVGELVRNAPRRLGPGRPYTAVELDGWAALLGSPEVWVRHMVRQPWFAPGPAARLRGLLGVRDGRRLLRLADAIGRVPMDIPRLARQSGTAHAKDLYRVAHLLGADPRDLAKLFPDRLAALGRTPEDRADTLAAQIAQALTDGYPEAGQQPGGHAWLLRVAAHHDIPWTVFTSGILPSLRENRDTVGPGRAQPDSAQVGMVVLPPAYRRPPAYSDVAGPGSAGSGLPAEGAQPSTGETVQLPLETAELPTGSDGAGPVAEAAESAPVAVAPPAYAEPVRLTEQEALAWARRWRVPVNVVTHLGQYSWFRPETVEELTTTLGMTDTRPVLTLAGVIGRIPTDIPALAREAGLPDAQNLLRGAAEVGVDPQDLMKLFPNMLVVPDGSGRNRWSEHSAELLAKLKDVFGRRSADEREPAWLFAVAAAYDVSGVDLLDGRFVDFMRRRGEPQILTPVDAAGVVEAVDDWWQSGARYGRTHAEPVAAWEAGKPPAPGPTALAATPAGPADAPVLPTAPSVATATDTYTATDTDTATATDEGRAADPERPVQAPEELVGWLRVHFGNGRRQDGRPLLPPQADAAETGPSTDAVRMLRVLQKELVVGWGGLIQRASGLLRPFLGRRTMTDGERSQQAGSVRREALIRIASALHEAPDRTTRLLIEAAAGRDVDMVLPPGGAPPQSGPSARRFGRAQALELARTAVVADMSAAAAAGQFVRNATAENMAANDLATWFMELVSRTRVPSSFEPSAALVRMYAAIPQDRRGNVQPDVLPYLYEQPDLVAAVGGNPRVRVGMVTRPGLARLLGAHPNLTRELVSVQNNARLADDAAALVKYPETAAALENDAVLRRQIVGSLRLVDVLGGDLTLLRATVDSPWLERALTELPQLTEVVRTADAPLKVIRTLNSHINLLLAIRATRLHPGASVDVDRLRGMLADAGLMRAMNRYPQQLSTVFRVPGLLAATQEDPGLLAVLDSDPDLSDVLTETPELATRLAGAPELLRVAFGNSDLAEALSYDPRRFDAALPDAELRELLRSAAPRRQPARREPGPQARPVQRLLADPVVQAALQGHNELTTELMKAPALVEVLLAHPNLLRAPHEYRRLLAPSNAELRARLTPGSPLLEEGVLRSVLRAPALPQSIAEAFRSPTAAVSPADPRNQYGRALADRPGMRPLVHADSGFREFLVAFQTLLDRIDGITGFGEALRVEGRLSALFSRDPFVLQFLDQNPAALPALLANESALLELVLAARHVTGALRQFPEQLAGVVERPGLLRALAAHPNDVTLSPHWTKLFEDPALLEVLDSDAGLTLVGALAADPDLLTDALGREAFVEELKRPGGTERYAALSRTPGVLAEAVRSEEPSITRSGIPVPAGLAGLALAVTALPEGEAAARIDEAVARGGLAAHRGAAMGALGALRERPELREAIDREFGVILAMLSNPELTPTLLKRPELIRYLADHTTGALKAVHDRPEFTRGLRENGRLYLRFISETFFVHTLASPTSDSFAEALGRNREFIRVHELGRPLPGALGGAGVFLVMASEAVSAAVADGKDVAAGLAQSPGLVQKLSALFVDDHDGVVTGPPWETAEAVARLVVSSPTLLRAVVEDPERLDGLVDWPESTRVLTENSRVLKTPAAAGALLDNQRLLARFHQYPEQAATVLRAPGLLLVADQAPRLVSAMAHAEPLAGLLGRDQSARTLLWKQPEIVDDLLRSPGLAQALSGLPGLVEALGNRPAVAGLLRRAPGLLEVLRARRTLVADLAQDSALWRALTQSPALVEVVSQSARVLRHLRSRPALVGVLASGTDQVALSGAQLRAVLSDDELTAVLDSQPGLAALVLRSPELADRAVRETAFADRVRGLARDPGRFERLLRAPGVLLAELDRPQTASKPTGQAGRQASGPGARAERSGTSAVPRGQGTATTVRPERSGTVPAALRPLERDHREVLVALSRDEEVLGLLEKTGLLGRVVASPELAALVAAFPDLAEEWQSAPGRMEEFRFGTFLGRGGASWDLERDFAAYADQLGALDVSLHGESRGWVRGAVEPTWRAAESAHRATVAAEQQEREERLSAFRPQLPDTWQYSGRVEYGNRLGEGSFSAAQRRTLTALAQGASRPRESAVRVNQALHAHLDSGSGGVSFAYVLGADGRVGLLVYGISTSRQGNDYRWDGNGSAYLSGPLPLEAAENAPQLLTSQQLVQQADIRRTENPASGSGQAADATRSPKQKKKGGKGGGGGRTGTGVRGAPPGAEESSSVVSASDVVVPVAVEPRGSGALVERLLGLSGEVLRAEL